MTMKVVDSRPAPSGWRRRHTCLHCGKKFTTREEVIGQPEPEEVYYGA